MSKEQKHNGKSDIKLFLAVFLSVVAFGGLIVALIFRKQTIGATVQIVEEPPSSIASSDNIDLDESEFETASEENLETSEEELPENTYRIDKSSGEEVTFLFAGDVLLQDEYVPMGAYKRNDCDIKKCFTGGLYEEMIGADVFMVNNEFTYSYRGEPRAGKQYTFRAKPENVNVLKEMGVDIVGAANNHISDYGLVSSSDTFDTLRRADIPYVGGGDNIDDATKVVYYRSGDTTVGIVCATQIERLSNPDTPAATETTPGTFRCLDPELLINKLKEADSKCDVLVLYIHWGTENVVETDWLQDTQVGQYVDAGADVIVGGHPHILQGIDYIKDVPVFYSLGNYWFSSKTKDTGLAKMTVKNGRLESVQFVPCYSSGCVVNKCDGNEKAAILNYMQNISPNVNIDSEGYITKKQ